MKEVKTMKEKIINIFFISIISILVIIIIVHIIQNIFLRDRYDTQKEDVRLLSVNEQISALDSNIPTMEICKWDYMYIRYVDVILTNNCYGFINENRSSNVVLFNNIISKSIKFYESDEWNNSNRNANIYFLNYENKYCNSFRERWTQSVFCTQDKLNCLVIDEDICYLINRG